MKNNISNEYAEALFALALEEKAIDAYYEELQKIKALFESNMEYIEFLSSPSVSTEEKLGAISVALEGKVNDNIVSFLKLLSERGRAELFFACLSDFEGLYNESKKTMLVRVTSATELNSNEKKKLKSALEKKYSLKVELKCIVDKSILGGIIVETEDSVLDGSLKKKLRDVKDVIKA